MKLFTDNLGIHHFIDYTGNDTIINTNSIIIQKVNADHITMYVMENPFLKGIIFNGNPALLSDNTGVPYISYEDVLLRLPQLFLRYSS